ncbi:unnamed protein product [Agarophyton chilense]
MTTSSIPTLIIVRGKEQNYLDKGVIPAVAEHILEHLCKKQSSSRPESVSIVLLLVRQPASVYDSLCKRLSIPPYNVLDAYSEWYSFQCREKEPQLISDPRKKVHLGDCDTGSKLSTVVADYMKDLFKEEKVTNRIVLIDSLDLLFPGEDIFNEILNLSDLLSSFHTTANKEQSKLAIVGILGQAQHHPAIVKYPKSLDAICDTSVCVSQVPTCDGKPSPPGSGDERDLIRLDIWRRKPSGRVHFEYVTGVMHWDEYKLSGTETKLNAADDAAAKQSEERDLARTLAEHGLSFRLSLNSKEREVRANAGLPYLHKDEKLADSAHALHPTYLQVTEESNSSHGLTKEYSSDECSDESDEEELFSEDV